MDSTIARRGCQVRRCLCSVPLHRRHIIHVWNNSCKDLSHMRASVSLPAVQRYKSYDVKTRTGATLHIIRLACAVPMATTDWLTVKPHATQTTLPHECCATPYPGDAIRSSGATDQTIAPLIPIVSRLNDGKESKALRMPASGNHPNTVVRERQHNSARLQNLNLVDETVVRTQHREHGNIHR